MIVFYSNIVSMDIKAWFFTVFIEVSTIETVDLNMISIVDRKSLNDSTVNIKIIDREGESHQIEAPTDMDMNIMELCKAYGLPVKGTCGGMALCSTCHVYVESAHQLNGMTEDEEDMLDQAFFVEDNSRLGCQLSIVDEMEGLVLRLAPQSDDDE